MKLKVQAFGLTCGIFWGLLLFFITWWIIALEGITNEVTFIGRIYLGYSISPEGSVIGMVWAFVDGTVAGLVFAWLYNYIAAPSQE